MMKVKMKHIKDFGLKQSNINQIRFQICFASEAECNRVQSSANLKDKMPKVEQIGT